MEGFEWLLEIRNGMSGPAAEMISSLKSLTSAMVDAEKSLRKMHEEAGGGAEEVGKSVEIWKELGEGVKKVGEYALEAAKEIGELTIEGVKLAVEANEMREHTSRMFEGLSGSKAGGEEMYEEIQKLRKILPESEADLDKWSAKLMGAGMTGAKSVSESLTAMASASALMGGGDMGEAAASKVGNLISKSLEGGKFKGNAKALVGTGVSADELAKQLGMSPEAFQMAFKKGTIEADKGIDALNDVLKKKGAGALEGTMGEIPTIIAKSKEEFAHMFDGVNIEPLTKGIQEISDALQTTQPAGASMKSSITGAFNTIIDLAGQVEHAMLITFLQIELGALQLENAFAPQIKQFKAWIHDADTMNEIISAIKITLAALAGTIAGLALTAAILSAPFVAFYKVTMLLVDAWDTLASTIGRVTGMHMPDFSGPHASSPGGGGGSSWDAPANAAGGLVGKPAPGEYFASVAPGETILPKGQLSVGGGTASSGPPEAPSRSTAVDVGGIHIHGGGETAHELARLLTSDLADVLEMAALEAGT